MRTTSPWVKKTLASLSLDEKLGQLLHPNVRPHWTAEDLKTHFPPVRVGGAFIFSGTGGDFLRVANLLQDGPGLPLVVSTDLESGAGRMITTGATNFPDLMSLAAANDIELARVMGEATAVEARAFGVHWTFGPVVDVNMHPGNPITNTRGLGDDPEKIAAFAAALVESMQTHGLAATVKHFPGDGWDDRDQHLATSINPLSPDEWERTSGLPYRKAFAAGCWTTMIGHIAMPSIDAGDPADPAGPPPAILSRKITTDFLRGTGFDGLVISDAIEMNGSVSRVRSAYDLIVKMINAGNDMLLFCNGRRDFEILKKAVAAGDITRERIDEACTRVLELKEKLGFAADPNSARPAADPAVFLAPYQKRFAEAAQAVARKAITAVRPVASASPKLKRGDKVLVMHLRSNPEYNVDGLDALLQARGIEIVRRTEADTPYEYRTMDFTPFAAVLILWTVGPTWGTGFIRPAGTWMRGPWFVRHEYPTCPVVHVSFGTPYLIHDVPWADTLLNAYSPDPLTQQAVADWLFGELQAAGTSPVDLERHHRLRELIRKEFA